MVRAFQRSLFSLALLALANSAWAQQGALTVPRNLAALTDRAATIVRGTVVSAHVERHPELAGIHTVVVTMRVKETLKGAATNTFMFRQFVWDARDRYTAAGYRKGDEFLLLMIAPSRIGLSSPAGMEQGRFRITRAADGRELAVNGQGNARLLAQMDAHVASKAVALSPASSRLLRRPSVGPVEIGELTSLIRDLVDARR